MTSRIRLAALFLAVAGALFGHAGWIHGKGLVGQWLMEQAWSRAVRDGVEPGAPWPGARTRPVARLIVPALQVDRLVLEGVDLPNLAWGPGLVHGAESHHVIAGHRDTHFRFLGELEPGDVLRLDRPASVARPGDESTIPRYWSVTDRRIADSRIEEIDLDAPGPLLTLITCYPLDGTVRQTPYRLLVRARPASITESAESGHTPAEPHS